MIIEIDDVELSVLRDEHFDSNNWRRALRHNAYMMSKQFNFDFNGVCMPHLVVKLDRYVMDTCLDDPTIVVPAGSKHALVLSNDKVRDDKSDSMSTETFYASKGHVAPIYDPSTNVGFFIARSDRVMGLEGHVYSTSLGSLLRTKPGDMIVPIGVSFKTFGTMVYASESNAHHLRSGRMITMLAVSARSVTFIDSDTSRIVEMVVGMKVGGQ